jgi:hypothetical protein
MGGKSDLSSPQLVSGGWDNRGMYRKFASAVVVFGLLVSSVTPANAIFGLSKCEKVKKQITNEEKVGLLLHNKYLEQRKIILAMTKPTWTDLSNVLGWLPDVYDSDLKVYKLVNTNSSCFTTQQVARARADSRGVKKNLSDNQSIRNQLVKRNDLKEKMLGSEEIEFVRNLYKAYFSFMENKKLN